MKTLFFTSANRPYECFIAPYAASVLHHNPDAIIEFAVEDADRVKAEHAKSLAILRAHFPDRITIRSADFTRSKPNTVRFITEPLTRCEYTYIGDIDVLVLDHITPMHLGNMDKLGLPYSNVLRTNGHALTGLHFTRTDAYYPIKLPVGVDLRGDDEDLLYKIVSPMGLPPMSWGYRPVHGIHLSMNRRPVGKPGEPDWQLTEPLVQRFQKLRSTALWQELAPLFLPKFAMLLLLLQVACDSLYPMLNVDENPRIGFAGLSRSLFGRL